MVITEVATTGVINAQPVPTGKLRFTGGSDVFLNGMVSDGTAKKVTIRAVSAKVRLVHESTGAAVADRFSLPNNSFYEIRAGATATVFYDTVSARWVLYSTQGPDLTSDSSNISISYNNGNAWTINSNTVYQLVEIQNESASDAIDINSRQFFDASGGRFLNFETGYLSEAFNTSVDYGGFGSSDYYFADSSGTSSWSWANRLAYDQSNVRSFRYGSNRLLIDDSDNDTVDYNNRELYTTSVDTLLAFSTQQTASGITTAGFTQNVSANGIYAESTATGDSGSTAYTPSDIVFALKSYGLLQI